MPDFTSSIGTVGGAVAILTAILSVMYLRRQTQLMAVQVYKQVEKEITTDLAAAEDTPEGAPRSMIDSNIRAFLNRRLSDIRRQMRDELGT